MKVSPSYQTAPHFELTRRMFSGRHTILYYYIQYYNILYYTTLYYTVLYYTILYYTLGATGARAASATAFSCTTILLSVQVTYIMHSVNNTAFRENSYSRSTAVFLFDIPERLPRAEAMKACKMYFSKRNEALLDWSRRSSKSVLDKECGPRSRVRTNL